MKGLVGAHRVGKSTLTKALVKLGFDELPISISEWQKELGTDSSNMNYSWETRKKIQERLIHSFRSLLFVQAFSTQITERTPLDLYGYACINAPENPTEEDVKWLNEYRHECIRLTNTYYTHVALIQPGIPYVETDKSAKEDTIEALNAAYLSLFLDSSLTVKKYIMPVDCTDIHIRANITSAFFINRPE